MEEIIISIVNYERSNILYNITGSEKAPERDLIIPHALV